MGAPLTVNDTRRTLDDVVRGIAAAGKALKLYPPTSPIPRQSVEAAGVALERFLGGASVLSLSVAREGLAWDGQPVATSVPGVADFADSLREHDVAEIDFLPGCTAEELIALLTSLRREPAEVRAEGGVGTALAAAGATCIRASEVRLTVVEEVGPPPDGDVDQFLKTLAGDTERLATWMGAASSGDPTAFAEGLDELTAAVGRDGASRLRENLAAAFLRQSADGKDALLGLSFEEGAVRDLAAGMFDFLQSSEIASAVAGGLYGKNMLSLSSALTSLPLQHRLEQVYRTVQQLLAADDRPEKECSFLEHMMEVRSRTEPEPALAEANPTYLEVAQVAAMSAEEIVMLREQTTASTRSAAGAGITTMLTLLDQQTDFALYCESVDGLAALVPPLLEDGRFDLALRVLRELSSRSERTVQPWPELTDRLRDAVARCVSQRSLRAVLNAVATDDSLVPAARDIVRLAGDAASATLVAEAIAMKAPGIAAAETILGRRILDLLAIAAAGAQWFQLAAVVERLASEGDPRSMQTVGQLAVRPDEQSRREVATGLAAAGTEPAWRLLAEMTADASPEVAIVAARVLARSGAPAAANLLAERLEALDMDSKDFLLAREIIGGLARLEGPEASTALNRISRRRTLIKRGHHAEIQELVRQAIELQRRRGSAV